jgi:hypothetical protein
MNLHNMSADELIRHTQLLSTTTTLMDALVNKLTEVKADLDKTQDLVEKLITVIHDAVDK